GRHLAPLLSLLEHLEETSTAGRAVFAAIERNLVAIIIRPMGLQQIRRFGKLCGGLLHFCVSWYSSEHGIDSGIELYADITRLPSKGKWAIGHRRFQLSRQR